MCWLNELGGPGKQLGRPEKQLGSWKGIKGRALEGHQEAAERPSGGRRKKAIF